MNKEQLINIINFWRKASEERELFPRDIVNKINIKSREIVDIVGPRRCGKSSILMLLIKNIKNNNSCLYINFEDPFFIENNKSQIIEDLISIYREYFSSELKYLFFDEIQNIENWEKMVRKLYDGTNYKIFITGSSSKLLSRELSSLITGRHISYELAPLTFGEFLSFKKIRLENNKDIFLSKIKLLKLFDKYIKFGGFPKIVIEEDEQLLRQYYLDILEKDIIKRYDIRQKNVFEKIGIYLLTNSSKTVSLSSLEKTFNISFEIVNNYLSYFKEAFLVFELLQFSYSLKKQQRALKKIYAVDVGLAGQVSFRFSKDLGHILENIVFSHLRIKNEIFYYRTKNNLEVDFLIKGRNNKIDLIQVCVNLDDEKTKQREINALLEALLELKISHGLLLTESMKDIIKIKNKTIKIIPIYEWLLTGG